MKKIPLILSFALAGALLTGCSPTPPPAETASSTVEATAPALAKETTGIPAKNYSTEKLAELPWVSTYAVYDGNAPEDTGTKFTGLAASLPTSSTYAVAYQSPGGDAFALIGETELSDSTALPVIQQKGGWVQVLISGRQYLASEKKTVNGASAWVQESALVLTEQPEEVTVDLSEDLVTVARAGKTVATYPVVMDGLDLTATGRGFFVSSYMNAAQRACSSEKLMALSLQSEVFNNFSDGIALSAIHGWAPECRAISFQKKRTSGCINLSDKSMKDLFTRIKPGTPVTITD